MNVSYESETPIAKQMGVDGGTLNGWLAGKVKPTLQSLLKIREFLERQVETRGRIAPAGARKDGRTPAIAELLRDAALTASW